MIIICAVTLLQTIRMVTYMWRIIDDSWSIHNEIVYRIDTDWTNYLLGIVALVLVVQWHQTYSVLKNPQLAVETFEKNWARKLQLALIVIYTIFIVFDTIVLIARPPIQ